MATATRTVLFTDMANYTASVARSDREGIRNLLAAHEKFVHPLITKRNGRVIKNLGDSYMALFDSATDAARAGLDIVEKVVTAGTLVIRVSCATGDVEEIDGDAFGEAVNLSARINSKTPAGEFWFAESTRICMNQAEIPWESVGQFALKGISGDVQCFRVVPRGKVWLPQPIIQGVKSNTLVRVRKGDPMPPLPPEPQVILEGFKPSSPELRMVLDSLPVLDPARLWLSTYQIAPVERYEWAQAGHGLILGTSEAFEKAIQEVKAVESRPSGSNTIILDLGATAELDMVMAGLALPSVPMAEVVAGYTYDLLPDGRWVNRSDQAIMRVDVNTDGVRVIALAPGVSINHRPVPPNTAVLLDQTVHVQTPAGTIDFHRLNDGNGYAGLMVADTPLRMGVSVGQVTELGREPNHPGMALPDRRHQENIRWCSGPRAARAREGGFTLDRALAGRRQAALEVGPSGTCTVRALHDRCPTFVYEDARPLRKVDPVAPVKMGELIVTGTTVVALRPPQT